MILEILFHKFLFVISCLYFFLPAYFTNMTPPFLAKKRLFKSLEKRVDFGKKIFGKDIFGSHKTWRGVVFGLISGISIAFLQRALFNLDFFRKISLLNYAQINIFLFGILISSGAIFGDLLFAFIKRRLNLKPGTPFFPFDQLNYLIGAFCFLNLFSEIEVEFEVWLTLFILNPILHPLVTHLGFWLEMTNSKW